MQTLAAGNPDLPLVRSRWPAGFTLLELLVVLAIVAIASVGVGLTLRDGTQSRLEREAQRLAALLESARARSQVTGVAVRWRVSGQGFRLEGLPKPADAAWPQAWLDPDTRARVNLRGEPLSAQTGQDSAAALLLGPEPIIEPQSVTLSSASQPHQQLRLGTDGVRPFSIQVEP